MKPLYIPITRLYYKTSGVYVIVSINTNKRYVGSTKNLYSRKIAHLTTFRKNKHSQYFQAHYDRYGAEDLTFEILEFCSKEILKEREQYWMDTLKPEFNICPFSTSSLGSVFSKEAKEKMSLIHKGKLAGEKNPMYGKIKERHPRFGKQHSKEAKEKMRNSHKGIQTGEKNPMYGKGGVYNIWINKYGKEEADKRFAIMKEKSRISKSKKIK